MSNYLSIAVVTATIQTLVQAAVSDVAPGVTVRIGPPRAVLPRATEANLYLYHLSPIPLTRAPGGVARPQSAALALHYMIAFSGEERLQTEIMLGKVFTVLEGQAVLTGADIARIIQPNGPFDYLRGSDLPSQPELIRLTPESLTLEQMTRLWSVFFQLAHRPTLCYVASPILLDAEDPAVVGG